MAIISALLLGLSQSVYLPNAHAHNDYVNPKPLTEAVSLGFKSIEVDVFPVNGKLLVGHDKKDLKPGNTIESMYLNPLVTRAKENGGWIYGPREELWLLVDIKEKGPEAYALLKQLVKPNQQYFTGYSIPGGVVPSAIRIILSGDRPIDIVKKEDVRYAFIDGRLSDLEKIDAELMPLISDSWYENFEWRGSGAVNNKDRFKLQLAVNRAHRQGQKLRFWATPDTPVAWKTLRDFDVDVIGTDQPAQLAGFLKAYR